MKNTNDEDIRLRITIDSEMTDLYEFISRSKKQSREIVHLARLGMQWMRFMGEGGPQALMAMTGAHLTGKASKEKPALDDFPVDNDPTRH